jgi:hypothetical protein
VETQVIALETKISSAQEQSKIMLEVFFAPQSPVRYEFIAEWRM